MTPAQVAEELMKNTDTDHVCLGGLVDFLNHNVVAGENTKQ